MQLITSTRGQVIENVGQMQTRPKKDVCIKKHEVTVFGFQ
jgi:hypothetical protein